MTLSELKLLHKTRNNQFITINTKGYILESDDALFIAKPKQNISKVHLFFESTLEILPSSETLFFSCVHLKIKESNLVCNISFENIKSGLYLITITEFSKHYKSLQNLLQSRNETVIKSEFLILKNQLLIEKETFKNEFIANFSHEVKSPITSVITFANLLNDTKLKQEQQSYLDVIVSSSFHLKSIINDILDISIIETGKLEIKSRRFNFLKLIEKLTIENKLKCNDKSLMFKVIIDKNIPTHLESDDTRIQQLIQNLLDNAIKFTPSGNIILEIKSIYRRAQNILLSIIVKDTGIGIEQKDYETIFKRFNRIENPTNEEGLGLGLPIVKEIVELMNGKLHFESKIGKGTTFTINIKVKSSLANKRIKQKTVEKTFKNKPKRKQNILLVEDNTAHQLGVFKILAKTKLFYLDIVSNGFDAIKAVNKTNYDIILMDFVIPSINGLETSKAIKNMSNKQKSNIPIILITGNKTNQDLLKYKGTYFYDIIEKPFEEETLVSIIQNCLK